MPPCPPPHANSTPPPLAPLPPNIFPYKTPFISLSPFLGTHPTILQNKRYPHYSPSLKQNTHRDSLSLSSMALTSANSLLPTNPFQTQQSFSHSSKPTFSSIPISNRPLHSISAVHSPESSKTPIIPSATASSTQTITKPEKISKEWTVESWKSKKALQLPEYPDQKELDSVLQTLDAFPPIVFAGEARNLEERLGEAAMGNAFLLQGGDCAESFKEFNANNIRDTFRILLQMGAVLMFGGQMPVIKVRFLGLCFLDFKF